MSRIRNDRIQFEFLVQDFVGPRGGPLTQHDVALRFLTAFIRLDRNMALKYATPQAVSKLNWNMSTGGTSPTTTTR